MVHTISLTLSLSLKGVILIFYTIKVVGWNLTYQLVTTIIALAL